MGVLRLNSKFYKAFDTDQIEYLLAEASIVDSNILGFFNEHYYFEISASVKGDDIYIFCDNEEGNSSLSVEQFFELYQSYPKVEPMKIEVEL
jgi:hypothetical protein